VKLPVLAGSRVAIVGVPDDAEILRPPAPVEPVRDVGAAARDALRFPLAGEPLEALVTRAGTATIVVEHPSLPLPSTGQDPRQKALAATADELERLGVSFERQTLLVAGGLERRARRHELERLVSPEFARRFRGRVVVHDAEDPALRELPSMNGVPVRVSPALLESDLVVTVTAAETVLHGGPACLVAAAGAEVLRGARADSLLEPGTSRGWDAALRLERTLARTRGSEAR
jgi:lactate racemase-like protein